MLAQRLRTMITRYPDQLAPKAVEGVWDLPQDVTEITWEHFEGLGISKSRRVLVTAGWPCQDLSMASQSSPAAGLRGSRSSVFYHLRDLLAEWQADREATGNQPIAYLLENVPMQFHRGEHHKMGKDAYAEICSAFGTPVVLDAAAVGSRAHRLRNYWTNLAPTAVLTTVTAKARRPAGRAVDDVLDVGWHAKSASAAAKPPFYQCRLGMKREALPTLVSTPSSWKFRNSGAGMLRDASGNERARAQRRRARTYHGIRNGRNCCGWSRRDRTLSRRG